MFTKFPKFIPIKTTILKSNEWHRDGTEIFEKYSKAECLKWMLISF
jgi:hypothetical protein